MQKRIREILSVMPEKLNGILSAALLRLSDSVEELRFRVGRPLIIGTANGNFAVLSEGGISPAIGGAYIVSEDDIRRIFCAICENSVYAHAEEIKHGYITIKGGHRVGFSGKAVICGGEIENIRDINSLNIRVASERIGCGSPYIDFVLSNGKIENTLVVSPPGCGKTTLLRDFTRIISNSGLRVSVIDERGEIAAMYKGVPQNDIGVQTDVLEDAPKEVGIPLMLRSMSPQVIICDEIATKEDTLAVIKSFGAGCGVIASSHGGSLDEIMNRSFLKPILGRAGFNKIIVLRRNNESLCRRISGDVFEVEK